MGSRLQVQPHPQDWAGRRASCPRGGFPGPGAGGPAPCVEARPAERGGLCSAAWGPWSVSTQVRQERGLGRRLARDVCDALCITLSVGSPVPDFKRVCCMSQDRRKGLVVATRGLVQGSVSPGGVWRRPCGAWVRTGGWSSVMLCCPGTCLGCLLPCGPGPIPAREAFRNPWASLVVWCVCLAGWGRCWAFWRAEQTWRRPVCPRSCTGVFGGGSEPSGRGGFTHSLAFQLTCLKRPLVVIHELFDKSIMDISW